MATKDELMVKTCDELRYMVRQKGLVGYGKANKSVLVNILADAPVQTAAPTTRAASGGAVTAAQMEVTAVRSPKTGNLTATVYVSCGANSDSFNNLDGKRIKDVSAFLQDVLNVDSLSNILVNGKASNLDYVLQAGDNLEFLKPSGSKG